MPRCGSNLHRYSSLPALVPVADFYPRQQGGLHSMCRHCQRVRMRLFRRYGTSTVDPSTLRTIWTAYEATRRLRAQRQTLPGPGERWCGRGHVTTPAAMAHGRAYCRQCECITTLRARMRRRDPRTTWEDAVRQYFLSPRARACQRNKHAPAGTRWCSAHGGYYLIPLAWRRRKSRHLPYCPACLAERRKLWNARYRARRRMLAA